MRHLLFIHGLWVTSASFDLLCARAEERGLSTTAPPWPGLDKPAAQLRHNPPPGLATLGVGELTDYYATMIAAMPQPPILVGHSLGGLIVQKLLDRNLGAAAVAIDPGPIRGVLPTPRMLIGALPILTSRHGSRRLHTMSRTTFAKDFANGLPAQDVDAAYDAHIIPAPGKPFFEGATALRHKLFAVQPGPHTKPLLLVAGTADRTVSPSTVRATYRRYQKAKAPVQLIEAAGHSHWLIAEPGWQQLADHIHNWIDNTVHES